MGDSELSAVRSRIEMVEMRLAALHDLGIDTAALQSQLRFAREHVQAGRATDSDAVCDEILAVAGRLTEGVRPAGPLAQPAQPVRTSGQAVRTSSEVIRAPASPHDEVMSCVREVLGGGLLSSALADYREKSDAQLDRRLGDFARQLREQFARELAQVMVARPWREELAAVQKAAAVKTAASASGEFEVLRARFEEIAQRFEQMTQSCTPDEVRAIVAAELAGTGSRRIVRARQAPPSVPLTAVTHQIAGASGESSPSTASADGAKLPLDTVGEGSGIMALQPHLGEALVNHSEMVSPDTDVLRPSESVDAQMPSSLMPRPEEAPAPVAPAPVATVSGASHSKPFTAGTGAGTTSVHQMHTKRTEESPLESVPVAMSASMPRPAADDDFGDLLKTGEGVAHLRQMIRQEITALRIVPNAANNDPQAGDDELAKRLLRVLPRILPDPQVRRQLFAMLALETASRPGALAELTGLRNFLRGELRAIADEIKSELGATSPV